jgi:hypothetical protein
MPKNAPKPRPPRIKLTARPLPARVRAQVDQLLDRLLAYPPAVWPA